MSEKLKQAWEMTREENVQKFLDMNYNKGEEIGKPPGYYRYGQGAKGEIGWLKVSEKQIEMNRRSFEAGHKIIIEQALSEGKHVPESVLKDYPDLKLPAKNLKYEDAIKFPKGGAVKMNADNIQATTAREIAEKYALRPEAVYKWANNNNIVLVNHGNNLIGTSNLDIITDVLNNETKSISLQYNEEK